MDKVNKIVNITLIAESYKQWIHRINTISIYQQNSKLRVEIEG